MSVAERKRQHQIVLDQANRQKAVNAKIRVWFGRHRRRRLELERLLDAVSAAPIQPVRMVRCALCMTEIECTIDQMRSHFLACSEIRKVILE